MTFEPLYERIKQLIRKELLASHAASDGARLPTERELQARYHVSRPTISKALTALAAEGLIDKSQGRGTFVSSPRPVTPASKQTPRRIGYVAPIAGEALVQRAFRGIDRVAHRRGYQVLLGNAGQNTLRERATAQELIAAGAQGLIVYPVPRTADEAQDDYLVADDPGIPVVLIDTCWEQQGHTQVVFDNYRAGYDMTAMLVSRGHKRIAFLLYLEAIHHSTLAARLHGYRDAIRDRGLPVDERLIGRYSPYASTMWPPESVTEWLALDSPPTAILAPEDTAAIDLIEHLLTKGIRVPEDIRIVGFDNREAARRFQPAFTTTNPDFERMGELACEQLLRGVEGEPMAERTYVLDVPILPRRSFDLATDRSGRAIVRAATAAQTPHASRHGETVETDRLPTAKGGKPIASV